MSGEAERRFPVRIKMAVPAGGFGRRLTDINAWLDANCGSDGWAMTPAGLGGVVNDAVGIYFLDPVSAAGFVARWCAKFKVEIADGAFQIRKDEPAPRISLRRHKTPYSFTPLARIGGPAKQHLIWCSRRLTIPRRALFRGHSIGMATATFRAPKLWPRRRESNLGSGIAGTHRRCGPDA